jgi:hypothetical protein
MKWIAIAFLSLGTCCPLTWGRTWTVGTANAPCANPDYATITAAINAAVDGDVIEICPALYPEQLLITKSLTLRGTGGHGIGRGLIQPVSMSPLGNLGFTAVITVMGTSDVTIQNLAIDAGKNTVSGCKITLAGIHFYNASGTVESDVISGTQMSDPLSCTTLFPGNGFGVQIDQSANTTAAFRVTVQNTSIHDFGRNGILVNGSGETVSIQGNSIVGIGPGLGVNQFGIFLANGAKGQVTGNYITQGSCGTIDILGCFTLRSEGVVLRSTGDGVVVDGNIISNVQAGVFVNGATNAHVTNNVISNVDALSGIHIQGSVSGQYLGNRIIHVGPFTTDTSSDEEGCGINDVSGAGNSANLIQGNWINDAYCGVAYVTGDLVLSNLYQNTLYQSLNGDDYPDTFPPPTEPGQAPLAASSTGTLRQPRRVSQ